MPRGPGHGRAVLSALASGPQTVGEIAAALSIPHTQACKTLDRLYCRGRVLIVEILRDEGNRTSYVYALPEDR